MLYALVTGTAGSRTGPIILSPSSSDPLQVPCTPQFLYDLRYVSPALTSSLIGSIKAGLRVQSLTLADAEVLDQLLKSGVKMEGLALLRIVKPQHDVSGDQVAELGALIHRFMEMQPSLISVEIDELTLASNLARRSSPLLPILSTEDLAVTLRHSAWSMRRAVPTGVEAKFSPKSQYLLQEVLSSIAFVQPYFPSLETLVLDLRKVLDTIDTEVGVKLYKLFLDRSVGLHSSRRNPSPLTHHCMSSSTTLQGQLPLTTASPASRCAACTSNPRVCVVWYSAWQNACLV